MKRVAILVVTYICLAMPTQAQDGELNKQVEVTKSFRPTIEDAEKLATTPNMIDTVTLRPAGEFNITPFAMKERFGVQAITPAKINSDFALKKHQVYAKMGLGYPINSVADVYVMTNYKTASWGGYINHRGIYSDLTNDMERTVSAFQNNNSIGLVGLKRWGQRALSAEMGYDNDIYTKYGEFSLPLFPLSSQDGLMDDPIRQMFQTGHAGVKFGDEFEDLSRLNFRVGTGGYLYVNRFNDREQSADIDAELGRAFGNHIFKLKGSFDGFWGTALKKTKKGEKLYEYDLQYCSSLRDAIRGDEPRTGSRSGI